MFLKYVSRYEPVNLPPLSEKIIEELYSIVSGYEFSDSQSVLREDDFENCNLEEVLEEKEKISNLDWNKSVGLPISQAKEYYKGSAYFTYKDAMSPTLWEWIEKNIPYKIVGASLFIIHGGDKLLPHRDFTRNQLNINLECNEEAWNYLYKIKDEYSHLETNAYSFIPYERLEVIQKEKLKKNQWYFFPCDIIHSVENIIGRRIVLALNIDTNYIT